MPLHRRPTRTRRRVVGVALGAAVSAVALMAMTSGPVQAAGQGPLGSPHQHFKAPAGAVRSDQKPEATGPHGRKFAPNGVTTKIVGGTTANTTDFPGVVGVRDYFMSWDDQASQYVGYMSTCTGTVISATKILTAAHCVTFPGFSNATIQVIAGRNDLDDETTGTVYDVSNVWTHQGYNLGAQYDSNTLVPNNDVAVVTLKKAIDPAYTPYQMVASDDTASYVDGTDAEIVGYGETVDGDINTAGVLHKGSIKIQSDSTCTSQVTDAGLTGYSAAQAFCAGTAPTTPGGTDGIDTCHGDSGGPLFVNGKQAGITDWGIDTCGSSFGYYDRVSYFNAAVTADVNRTNMPVNLDFSGDGHADLMFEAGGLLGQVTGTGLLVNGNFFGPYASIADAFTYSGAGWDAYTKLFRVTNWNGDGTESIFAMKSNGSLYQYKTDGYGNRVGGAVLIGSGWTMFNDIVVTNNWTGNGRPNLMGRKANGDLILYTSNGAGGWTNSHGTLIGTGWSMFNTIITPGNWRGGGQAMIGRTTTGDLRLYESNGAGGWKNGKGTLIGTGWNGLPTFLSPGDWNGDNLIDIIGVAKDGSLKLYRTDGLGHWLNGHGDLIAPAGYTTGAKIF